MIVFPGFNMPFLSASSIIYNAILSLVEWPGLNPSIFAKYSPFNSAAILFNLIIGVSPMRSNILFAIFLLFPIIETIKNI